ncbi:MAG: hypothetical protein EOP51_03225 [Sphingobacteriales bacterium]|nr:MAG: hypothetical protein EOP51_03225 [Sphingobacteriales bacterium]
METNRLSKFSFVACLLLMCYATFSFYPKWGQKSSESPLGWDVAGYYWYLPAIFIYKDLKEQKFGDSIINEYKLTPTFDQSFVAPNGGRVNTYAAGMAVMYSPLFFTAHFLAPKLGYPADGFSTPYQFAIQVGSLLVALIGIWFFRKLLLLFYSDGIVAAMLLLLVFGTNYLNYAAIDAGLTHNWLFTLYVFLLLNTYYFYRSPNYKNSIAIGLLCGLATLARPSEVICILIPILWGMESLSWNAIKNKWQFLYSQFPKVVVCAICVILVGSIQIIYWKYVADEFLVYSYGDKGFSWLKPHLGNYVFSYRSGWITYTPVMICSILGILPFLKTGKNKVAILAFFILNLYIVCAWDIWWYGGTGGRAMIQSYPIIMLPFASLLQYLSQKQLLRRIAIPIIVLLAYFNIWFTYNAHGSNGLYDSWGMTSPYYWKVIYRYHVGPEVEKLKDANEIFEGTPKELKGIYSNGFEDCDSCTIKDSSLTIDGHCSLLVKEHSSSKEYTFPYERGSAKWLRAEATFRSVYKEWEAWRMTQFVVRFKKGDTVIKENMIRLFRWLDNGTTKNIYIDTKIPKEAEVIATELHRDGITGVIMAIGIGIYRYRWYHLTRAIKAIEAIEASNRGQC